MFHSTPHQSSDRKHFTYHEDALVMNRRNEKPRVEERPLPKTSESTWKPIQGTAIAIVLPYLLALGTAIAHFVLCKHLNNKRVDYDTIIPQSWIPSIAFVLVTTFRMSICFCIGVAFVQYLWRTIRLASMTLADFERLHHVRLDLRALLHQSTIRHAPALCAMAAVTWLVNVAIIFPPGALTVVSKDYLTETEQDVPVFNSSAVGNGTYADAMRFTTADMDFSIYKFPKTPVSVIAKGTLFSGDIAPTKSGCGSNCNYTTIFYGPHATCNTTTFHEVVTAPFPSYGYFRPTLYSGGWDTPTINYRVPLLSVESSFTPGWWCYYEDPDFRDLYRACLNVQPSNFSLSQHKNGEYISSTVNNVTYERETQKLSCRPGRAQYTLKSQTLNGARSLQVSVTPDRSLESMWDTSYSVMRKFNYSDPITANYSRSFEVMNLFALFDSVIGPLAGEVYGLTGISQSLRRRWTQENSQMRFPRDNGTIIVDTVFNKARYDSPSYRSNSSNALNNNAYEASVNTLQLDLTEDTVNQALQNITLSVMYALDWWHTRNTVTHHTAYNIFSFSSPLKLILPYALSLLATLPCIFLGLRALRLNGVSAVDGGFIQPLVTTTGSSRLRELAAMGCDAPHDVPKELKQTKIRFGHMNEYGEGGVIRRAAFGLEDEIIDTKI